MGQKGNSERLRELEVAVGTVNWLLKRLAAKGYVKVKRIGAGTTFSPPAALRKRHD